MKKKIQARPAQYGQSGALLSAPRVLLTAIGLPIAIISQQFRSLSRANAGPTSGKLGKMSTSL